MADRLSHAQQRALFVAHSLLPRLLGSSQPNLSSDPAQIRALLSPATEPLTALPQEAREQVAAALADAVSQAISDLVTQRPDLRSDVVEATEHFDEHAADGGDLTGWGGEGALLAFGIGAAIALVIFVHNLSGEIGRRAGAAIEWRLNLRPGVEQGLVDITEQVARAVESVVAPGAKPIAGATPKKRRVRSANDPKSGGGELSGPDNPPQPPGPARQRDRLLDAPSPPPNDEAPAAAAPAIGTAALMAPPSLGPNIATPLQASAFAGSPFHELRTSERVLGNQAAAVVDWLFEKLGGDGFRDLDPWLPYAVGRPPEGARQVGWSVGVLPETTESGRRRFRCAVRVQLPMRVERKLLREISALFDEHLGPFISFRWTSPATLAPGPSWRGARDGFHIGASIGLQNRSRGSVGLLMAASENRVFAVTAGHCLTDNLGRPVIGATAFSAAPARDVDPEKTATVRAVTLFPEWAVGGPRIVDSPGDLGIVEINDASFVPGLRERRRVDQVTIRDQIAVADGLARGERVAKVSARSRFQTGEIVAVGVRADLRDDTTGQIFLGNNLLEIAFDEGSLGVEAGDSGALVLLENNGFWPLAIVTASSSRSLIDGHDTRLRPVAYATLLHHHPALRRMKVL